jgi:hypothetical protein
VACLWWIAGCARRIDPVEQAETVGASAGNIVGVDHLAIRVTDMQRSGEFYARLFGPEVKKPPLYFSRRSTGSGTFPTR